MQRSLLIVFIIISFIIFICIQINKKKESEKKVYSDINDLIGKNSDVFFYHCKEIQNERNFYNLNDYPQLKLLQDNYNIILKELNSVIQNFEKPGILFPNSDIQESWKNFWFLNGDRWNTKNIKLCPKTYELLKKIGVKREALFARLEPNSKINSHKGTGNYVIRVQFALKGITHQKNGIMCGDGPNNGDIRYHKSGEFIIFDDSKWHSAWNDSDIPRYVLIFDLLPPKVTESLYQKCVSEHSMLMEPYFKKINKYITGDIKNTIENGILNK